MLKENDYPEAVLETQIRKAKRKLQYTRPKPRSKKTNVLSLPFLTDGCSRAVSGVLEKQRLLERTRVVFKSGVKLQDMVTRSPITSSTL